MVAVDAGVRYSAGLGGRRGLRGAPFGRALSDMSNAMVPGLSWESRYLPAGTRGRRPARRARSGPICCYNRGVSRLPLFVVVAPGLERLAADELASIGIPAPKVRVQHGGLDVQATTRQLYAIHRWARIPTRVLVRVATGTTRNWDELQGLVRTVDWSQYLPPAGSGSAAERGVELHVASHRSVLYHQGAIAERVTAVLDRPVSKAGQGGQGVHVRLDRDRAVVSVDASGELLHRRGWRSETHRSPVRTTIAAAMVRASGWDGSVPLVDPLAGSGTIAIEAALWAAGRPIERPFAFQGWPTFEPGTWASVTGAGRPDGLRSPVLAADRDAARSRR